MGDVEDHLASRRYPEMYLDVRCWHHGGIILSSDASVAHYITLSGPANLISCDYRPDARTTIVNVQKFCYYDGQFSPLIKPTD